MNFKLDQQCIAINYFETTFSSCGGVLQGMEEVKSWFSRQVEEPMQKNGIEVTLSPVRVSNPLKKPGPVFVAMARLAYEMDATYFYRVNDDTEFRGRWPTVYVKALLSLSPPYGVVGPSSLGSVDAILTHDFVHRTHMEIFRNNYYPVELTGILIDLCILTYVVKYGLCFGSDWWMDDWISRGIFIYYNWKSLPDSSDSFSLRKDANTYFERDCCGSSHLRPR